MNDENEILIIGDVLSESVCARLAAAYKVHHIGGDNNARDQFIAAHGANIGAVITGGHGGCDDALMARLPALKIIASYGVGYDGIDTVAAAKRGVWVSNTPDVLNDDVADLALALMLAVVRQVVRLDDYVRVGEWQKRGDFALTDRLTGKRLGMLGMGRIGGAIVRRARAFDMAISYHATARKSGVDADFAASPVALAEGCDILCVAMPATEKNARYGGRKSAARVGRKRLSNQHRTRRIGGRSGADSRPAKRRNQGRRLGCFRRRTGRAAGFVRA